MKKVLLISTVPAFESYNIGLIRAAFLSKLDVYACIFLMGIDHRSKNELMMAYEIPADQEDKVQFLKLSANKVFRIFSSSRYLSQIVQFAQLNQIFDLHFISQDVMLYGHLRQFRSFKIYYTVHDLQKHEDNYGPLKRLKHWYFRIRKDQGLIYQVSNLVTNSRHQRMQLEEDHPGKKVFYHQMPGLITFAIRSGQLKVPELVNETQYVLFFGRLETYKGLDLLYDNFTQREELKDIRLVIAGRGPIYFKRKISQETNIIFINRFIQEAEFNELFSHASLLVLPYKRATQSAVSSLAHHYRLPVVATNIDGLNDTILHEKTGFLYQQDDPAGLSNALLTILENKQLNAAIRSYLQNDDTFFNIKTLAQQLKQIYS
jgi:glycosyltransferase involved in cell wall biosynthesis